MFVFKFISVKLIKPICLDILLSDLKLLNEQWFGEGGF